MNNPRVVLGVTHPPDLPPKQNKNRTHITVEIENCLWAVPSYAQGTLRVLKSGIESGSFLCGTSIFLTCCTISLAL